MSEKEHFLIENLFILLRRLLKKGNHGKLEIDIVDGLPILAYFKVKYKIEDIRR